jgi:hypothetical protein
MGREPGEAEASRTPHRRNRVFGSTIAGLAQPGELFPYLHVPNSDSPTEVASAQRGDRCCCVGATDL